MICSLQYHLDPTVFGFSGIGRIARSGCHIGHADGLQAGFVDALRGKRVDDRLRPTLLQPLIVRIAAHVIGMADDKHLDLLL